MDKLFEKDNKDKSIPKKASCQSEYHSKKKLEDAEEEEEGKYKVKNTFRARKVR